MTDQSSQDKVVEPPESTAELRDVKKRLAEREAELTVLNTIGQALAARTEPQAIYDLVGERLGEIFKADTTSIILYDRASETIESTYYVDRGQRQPVQSIPMDTGIVPHIIQTREPLIIGSREERLDLAAVEVPSPGSSIDLNESVVGVPMLLGDEIRGAVSVQSYQEQAYNESHLRLLTTIVANMTVALENARLFDETSRLLKETKQRNAELQLINDIGQALAAQTEMQAIYDLVGGRIRDIFDAQVVTIVSFDLEQRISHYQYIWEKGERLTIEPQSFSKADDYFLSMRGPWVQNEKLDEFFAKIGHTAPAGKLPKSLVSVPLMVGEKIHGYISIQNIDREKAFGKSDVRLLHTLAASMSVTLENARLFDDLQKRNREITAALERETASNEILRVIAHSPTNVQPVLDVIVYNAAQFSGLEDAIIGLAEGDTLLVAAHHGDIPMIPVGEGIRFNRGSVAGRSIIEGRTVQAVHNQSGAESEYPDGDRVAQKYGYRMTCAVPLMREGKAIGAISIRRTKPELLSENQIALLQTFANQAAIALENVRLFNETKHLLKETEQRNAELTIINSIGQALSQQLEFQPIVDLVGEKIGEIFQADTTFISLYDRQAQVSRTIYYVDRGLRQYGGVIPLGQGLVSKVIETRRPVHSSTLEESRQLGAVMVPSPDAGIDLNESWLGVPMLIGDEVKGVVSVQSYQQHAFSESDVRLLSTIAANMIVALENVRLFDQTTRLLDETQQRAAELATVNQISRALASELELDALIDLVGDQMRQTFEADIAYVALHDRPNNQINFPYVYGDELASIQYGAGLTSHVLELGKPLLINEDIDIAHEQLGAEQVGTRAQSYLGVPVFVGGETIGVISVQSTSQEGRFDEDDVRLLTTIAGNVGAAIHNAQLYQETERRAEEMAALAEIGRDISSVLDMSTVLGRITRHACELLKAPDSAVYLPNETGETFRAIVAVGSIAEQLKASPVIVGKGIMGDVVQRLKPELVNDTASDPRVVYIPGTPGGTSGRMIAMPLLTGARLSGIMAVWRREEDAPFTQADLNFLVGLARQAAIAIENARLFARAEEAQAAAEAANRAKSTFLANMSHELRTPLNAIMGFTRIVKRRGAKMLPERQIENLEKVLVSSEHLLALINTILDIAKIESGRLDVRPTKFRLATLVQDCVTTSQPLVQRGVNLVWDVADDVPPIHSDQEKVKQILLNLLGNAAKFTKKGQISIAARSQNGLLVVEVSDTGIGIPEEALETIFEEFQQVDTSTTRQYGGTGLGLSISRKLANLLGGDLTAVSSEGQGSTFTLTLPVRYGETPAVIAAQTSAPSPNGPQDAAGGRLVLAIDDDPDAIYLLQDSLRTAGYRVIGATSGDEGLRLAREQRPLAITLDIMMPHKDGWQVLHELKTDPKTRDIPVIMLTIVDKKSLGYRLGAADYLVKPLDEEAVLAALRRLAPTSGAPPRRLLAVDDDLQVLDMIGQLLEAGPYEVATAADGELALESINLQPPDIILLDLLMPRLDGFGVIERLKKQPERAGIPIIVLTAKELTAEEEALLHQRVDRVIHKQGLDEESLMEEIRQALGELP